MSDANRQGWIDPHRAYNFKLQQQSSSDVLGHFTRCTGMGIDVEPILFREGGSTDVIRLAGPVRYGDITLEYGLTDDLQLWHWMQDVLAGRPKQDYQRNVSVVLLDPAGTTEVLRWDLIAAWPTRWRGSLLDAAGQEVAIESMTLVFDRLVRG